MNPASSGTAALLALVLAAAAADGATITGSGVRVRLGPNARADVLATLPAGTSVAFDGERKGDFCRISFAGGAGWVACRSLDESGAADREPPPTAGGGQSAEPRHSAARQALDAGSAPERPRGRGGVLPRHGFFVDAAVGVASGNFTLTGSSTGDEGSAFRLSLGGAFRNGLGLGGSLSAAVFEYESRLAEAKVAELSFAMVSFDAWYFGALGESWELSIRGSLGETEGTAQVGPYASAGSGLGTGLALGATWFATDHFGLGLSFEVVHYGVSFVLQRLQSSQDEVTTTGVSLSLRHR